MIAIPERLRLLFVSPMPPSPPRFGAQARTHGLLSRLGRRHDVTAVCLFDPEFEQEACTRGLAEYCQDVTLVPNPLGRRGLPKRLLQLRSLVSRRTYQRLRNTVPGFQETLDRTLRERRFDLVFLNFPYLSHYRLRQSPPGSPAPAIVIDSHDIGYDLARRIADTSGSFGERLYGRLNARKLAREEKGAYAAADGVCVCSAADQARLAADVPEAQTVVIPNAADVDALQPRPNDPRADGRTVLFFGLLSTTPNVDGMLFFLGQIWPRIAAARPLAQCKIVGGQAPPAVLAAAGPRVEFTGLVEDLRPHLASAAVVVVPLRLGGGTRLKIVEAWAMGKAIVSTTLGAEGIEGVPGRDILIADDAEGFATAVVRVLDDPAQAAALGGAGRRLAVERYSWPRATQALEHFFRERLAARQPSPGTER